MEVINFIQIIAAFIIGGGFGVLAMAILMAGGDK